MVTVGASRAAVVTGAAVLGLVIGLWVQDKVKDRAIARVEKRIADEVARRLSERSTGPGTPHQQQPSDASGTH